MACLFFSARLRCFCFKMFKGTLLFCSVIEQAPCTSCGNHPAFGNCHLWSCCHKDVVLSLSSVCCLPCTPVSRALHRPDSTCWNCGFIKVCASVVSSCLVMQRTVQKRSRQLLSHPVQVSSVHGPQPSMQVSQLVPLCCKQTVQLVSLCICMHLYEHTYIHTYIICQQRLSRASDHLVLRHTCRASKCCESFVHIACVFCCSSLWCM